jgi:hypothetical protein
MKANNISSRQNRSIKDMIGVIGLASPKEEEVKKQTTHGRAQAGPV